ncbi:Serine/threonine protein kinase [Candidatus Sulfopaludibacter sp. SbA3]|nr:Serine/threonine protein kinase [Candidatus Sulfopaludibacter sp. SbA3]
MSFFAGQRIGPYELIEPLGAGGMGQVWKALDTRLDRMVAIKFSGERFSDRFDREAHAIAALNHPHICTLFDIGPDYLVMEYVEGAPLRGPVPVRIALAYGAQIAGALHAAHSRGIVHRDLKPANILVTQAGIKLLDFGLAKVATPLSAVENTATIPGPLTRENTILGTLQYMSPEQLEGRPADSRSDIFTFGLVLHELIAGQPAFRGDSQAGLIAAVLKEDPAPLNQTQPAIPAALDRIVRKCLAKDPGARWQSASDLRDELEWVAQTPAPVAPTPIAEATPPRRWLPAHLREPALALLALLAFLAAGLGWMAFRAEPPGTWSAVRLSGPPLAFLPRVSPDGQLVAFATLVDGNAQLGVMRSDGSSWAQLTNQTGIGYVSNFSWAPGGSSIYFDRFWDTARGVFSIPTLGGTPRLVLDKAFAPQALPDGSLIVAEADAQRDFQLFHYTPDTGRSDPLPIFFDRNTQFPEVRVFPDGQEIVFFGFTGTPSSHPGPRELYVYGLASRSVRKLTPTMAPWLDPGRERTLAVTPDGKSLVTLAMRQDLFQVVRIPRDGSGSTEILFSFPKLLTPFGIDLGPDGSIYLDGSLRPMLVLRLPATGGVPEQTPAGDMGTTTLIPAGDDRFVYPTIAAGLHFLVAGSTGSDPRPVLQAREESDGPLALSAGGNFVFLIGNARDHQIALASLRDGRIVRRIPAKIPPDVTGLATSPDGTTVYYAAQGGVWSVAVEGNAVPRRICDGDSVAVDPAGRFLYIKQLNHDPAALLRIPIEGGAAEDLPIPAGLHLTNAALPANCVTADGRVVVETATPNSFFYRPAVVDARHQTVTPIPVAFAGDVWSPTWTPDGHILAAGAGFESSVWRYRKQ